MQPAVSNPAPRTPSSTGSLEIMDLTGDSKVFWDRNNPDEVAAARVSFDALKTKGYSAYKLGEDGSTGEQIREFDATAERIIMRPAMRGG